MHALKHLLLTIAALIFLAESWLWDKTTLIIRWIIKILPLEVLKSAIAGWISRRSPYAALSLFIIPFALIEALKTVAVAEIATGHVLGGILSFTLLNLAGVGLIAFVFELTREKVLTIPWFARFFAFVVKWRAKANEFISPYKSAVIAKRTRFAFIRMPGSLLTAIRRLRASNRKTPG